MSAQLRTNGGIALHSLCTEGVACNDNLLHVGKQGSVIKVLNDLVQDGVRAGVLGCIRVLIIASSRPLR